MTPRRLVPLGTFARSVLRAHGQLFFCEDARTGALVALAALAADPISCALGVAGGVAATASALLLGLGRPAVEAGLLGFNGVIVGYALRWLPEPATLALALTLGAAFTAPLTASLGDRLSRRVPALPPLSMPALFVAWPLQAALSHPPLTAGAALAAAPIQGIGWGQALASAAPPWALLVLGVAVASRRTALLAAGGLVLGVAVAVALGLPPVAWFWLAAYAAVPTTIGLGGVFLGRGGRNLALTAVVATVAAVAWTVLARLMAPIGVSPLSSSFVVLTLAVLCLRAPRRTAPLTPPVPTARAPLVQAPPPPVEPSDAERAAMARAVRVLAGARRIVALTGAGISTESGIPDYRSSRVAWRCLDPADFLYSNLVSRQRSRAAYWESSQGFWRAIARSQPNGAHRALAAMAQDGRLTAVITQNVDGLHQAAGTPPGRVLELHGSEHTVSCLDCGARHERSALEARVSSTGAVPYCERCQGILKPDTVAFGQPLSAGILRRALRLVTASDALLVVGSSLTVPPASTLPLRAKEVGSRVVLVNLGPTRYDNYADAVVRWSAGRALPALELASRRTSPRRTAAETVRAAV
ncbi:MAG: urea transporter [Planctomycetes bacterium]|nr:urea transporter [Planctomycetota bacterium]